MKDKSIRQPWPRSARITVWALSILLVPSMFYALVVEPSPCRCYSSIVFPPPKPSCLPVVESLADRLKDQRTRHPEDFPSPRTDEEKFIKEILDSENTKEYLQAIGY